MQQEVTLLNFHLTLRDLGLTPNDARAAHAAQGTGHAPPQHLAAAALAEDVPAGKPHVPRVRRLLADPALIRLVVFIIENALSLGEDTLLNIDRHVTVHDHGRCAQLICAPSLCDRHTRLGGDFCGVPLVQPLVHIAPPMLTAVCQ